MSRAGTGEDTTTAPGPLRPPVYTLRAVLSLTIQTPGEPVRRFLVDRPAVTLGRASTNDVFLVDRTLSRVHARLDETPEGFVLTDLGSRNGTLLNGARIGEEAIVGAGSVVTSGTIIPPRSMAVGTPAKVVRELTEKDFAMMHRTRNNYLALMEIYKDIPLTPREVSSFSNGA